MDNNQIHFRAELTIKEGKTEEFKKLIQDLSKVVEANEPDTIEYQFYVNGSEKSALFMKRTEIQKPQLLIIAVLHPKKYFQGFLIYLR